MEAKRLRTFAFYFIRVQPDMWQWVEVRGVKTPARPRLQICALRLHSTILQFILLFLPFSRRSHILVVSQRPASKLYNFYMCVSTYDMRCV
jgi:hypothetical protein